MGIITNEQRDFWRDNSYLLAPGMFAHRVGELVRWVDEVLAWSKDDNKWLIDYEAHRPEQVARVENFTPYHPRLAEILTREPVIGIISELMGGPALLYKERINPKYPGGGPHAAHQDGVAFDQFERRDAQFDPSKKPYISVLIGVDRASPENGCLQVVPWPIDKLDILPMEAPDPERPHYFKIKQSVEDSLPWRHISTAPGDALFFTERIPHRSDPNMSQDSRRILYAVYNPASEGDKHDEYYKKKRADRNNPRYHIGNPHALIDKKI